MYFFICNLTIQLVKAGGFSLYGWDSKVFLLLAGIASKLVDNGKGLFLWGVSKILFVDYSERKKSNWFNFNK